MDSESTQLPDQLRTALARLVDAMNHFQIQYALIGGLASGYRSRPRFTRDIDLLLSIPQIVLPRLLELLEKRGFEFDHVAVIREFIQNHMTSLSFQGIQIDWLKPVIPLFQHVLDTAQVETTVEDGMRIASAEGLILMKLIAFRRQDQLDIEDLLAANRGQLDLEFIRQEWQAIEEPGDRRWSEFQQMVESYYRD
jgi:hypothetical protein